MGGRSRADGRSQSRASCESLVKRTLDVQPPQPPLQCDEELGRFAGAPVMRLVCLLFSSVVAHRPALDQSVASVPQDINSHLLEWLFRTVVRHLPHARAGTRRPDPHQIGLRHLRLRRLKFVRSSSSWRRPKTSNDWFPSLVEGRSHRSLQRLGPRLAENFP